MISQIPEIVYAVSISRARLYKTSLGTFSIHHLDPGFFFGFQSVGRMGIKMASPEKALVDFVYLSPNAILPVICPASSSILGPFEDVSVPAL